MPTTTATPRCARLPAPRFAYFCYCSHRCMPSPPPAAAAASSLAFPCSRAAPPPSSSRARCAVPPRFGLRLPARRWPRLRQLREARALPYCPWPMPLLRVSRHGRARPPPTPQPAPRSTALSPLLRCSACCFRRGPPLQRVSPAPCSSAPRPADRGYRLRPPWPSRPAPSSAGGLARA
nr:formin-like protein 5 [Aegilops tauschii subsp. strangulata]